MTARRIAAIVLPELLIELAREATSGRDRALGVVVGDPTDTANEPLAATAILDAVDTAARHYGVREGQSIAEARALVAKLDVRVLRPSAIEAALGRVAEVALAFGIPVSLGAPDTVWVDISASAHLAGGEALLAAELAGRVRALGHVARVAVAGGPLLARAFARWLPPSAASAEERGVFVVPAEQTREWLAPLPVTALPLAAERAAWLVRLGVFSVGDLAKLPRAASASRLGEGASRLLDLCEGRDEEPLVAYDPPRTLVEEASFEDCIEASEPLLFVVRGLAARLGARLGGRGEAAQALRLVLLHDHSIAGLRGIASELELKFELASPLWREEEIRRVVASRLERLTLQAPCVGLRLEAPSLTERASRQLDLSRVAAGLTATCRGAEALPVVLAELVADVGKAQVGVLALCDAHRPEQRSKLGPATRSVVKAPAHGSARRAKPQKHRKASRRPALRKATRLAPMRDGPTRLLPVPVPLEAALRAGATLSIDRRLYTIERVSFEERLDSVEWWSRPVGRDYLRVWLRNTDGMLEALVYVERDSGRRFFHAIAD
jgi:protein ImuB